MDSLSLPREDTSTDEDDQKTRGLKESLSQVLAELRRDDRNPNLWMKAVKVYLALGDLDRSLNCCIECLKIDDGRKDAWLLMSKLPELYDAQEWFEDQVAEWRASGQDEAEAHEVRPNGEQPELRPISGEDAIVSRTPILWVPEWDRSIFDSEEEALGQLQEELTPSKTAICLVCNTMVGVEKKWCHGCGREMKEKVQTLDERVDVARARLQENEEDRDALFTLGAYFAVKGQHQEAVEALNKLSILDPRYPGLWWLKVRIFQLMGRPEAVSAASRRARKALQELLEDADDEDAE